MVIPLIYTVPCVGSSNPHVAEIIRHHMYIVCGWYYGYSVVAIHCNLIGSITFMHLVPLHKHPKLFNIAEL